MHRSLANEKINVDLTHGAIGPQDSDRLVPDKIGKNIVCLIFNVFHNQ